MADLDPSGTLDFFILQKLSHAQLRVAELERHTERIRLMLELTAERKGKGSPATLSIALRRLERQGWLQIKKESTLEKIYSLIESGRDHLQTQQANWTALLNRFIEDDGLDGSFRRFLDRDS